MAEMTNLAIEVQPPQITPKAGLIDDHLRPPPELHQVDGRDPEDWKWPPREWFEAKTQFAVVFGERFVSQ